MSELAVGYVSIVAETRGMGRAIDDELRGAQKTADRYGRSIGTTFSKGFKASSPVNVKRLEQQFNDAEKRREAAVRKSTQTIEGLRRKEEIANAKLAEAQEKYAEGSSQVLVAQDRAKTATQRLEVAQAKATAELERADRSVADAKRALDDYNKSSDGAARGIRGAFGRISGEARNMGRDVSRSLGDAGKKASTAFKDLGRGNFRDAFSGLKDAAETASTGVRGAFSKLPGISRKIGKDTGEGFGNSVSEEMDAGGKRGAGFFKASLAANLGASAIRGALSGVTSAISGAFSGGWDRLMNIEAAESKFKVLGINAKAAMDDVNAAVDGTRFAISDAADMASVLGGAGMETGETMQRWLKITGDSAQFMNREFTDMQNSIQKVAQEGRVTGATFRELPIATSALADHLGVSQQEVRKLASAGKISSEEFLDAMEKSIGGMASGGGTTMTSMLSNIKTAWSATMANLLEGVTEQLGPALEKLLDGFKGIRDAAKPLGVVLGRVAGVLIKGLFKGFDLIGSWVAKVGPTVTRPFNNLRSSALDLWDSINAYVVPVFSDIGRVVVDDVLPFLGKLGEIALSVLVPAFNTVVGVVKGYLIPTFATIVKFIANEIIPVVMRVANEVVLPVMKQIRDFIVTKILPAFSSLVGYITRNIIPVVLRLYKNVFLPAFEGIGKVVKFAWDVVVYPALNALWGFVTKVLAPVIKWLWEKVVAPAFDGIGKAVKWAWERVVKPVFDGIKWTIDNVVAPTIRWLNDKVFTPIFKTLGETVDKFGRGWSKMWDGIKSAAAKPVNFVIGTVWNNGLRKALNLIPGVNLAEAKTISVGGGSSRGVARGAAAFRKGGYTGKLHPDHVAGIVHGNEYVLTSEETDRLGGPRGVEAWKRAALERGYRSGGSVKPVRASHSGWKGGKYRSGKWHGGLDFPARTGTPIYAMWDGIVSLAKALNRSYGHHVKIDHGGGVQTLYAHMSRIMTSVGRQVKAGQQIGAVGSTGNSTGPHLHLEVRRGGKQVNPEPYLSGAKLPKGGIAGAIEAGWEFITKVPSMFDGVRKRLGELTGPWGDIAKKAATHAVDKAWSWAKDKLNPFSGSDDGSGFKYSAGGKVERWRPLVLRALAHVGQPASLADTTLRRLNQESGGNPKAINRWDKNAKMGIPSKGLMQVIGPTFRAYRDKSLPNNIWDPMANIVASMRYAKARYGSLSRAYNKRGGYLTGGTVEATGPAWLSEDGRPELVVGPQVQNMQAGSRVYNFEETRELLGGSKGNTRITNIDVTAPRDAFRDVAHFMQFISDLEHRAQIA